MKGAFQKLVAFAALLVLGIVISGCAVPVGSESSGPNPPLQVSQILVHDDTLSVIGYGQASSAPDLAIVSLGVMVAESDVALAVDQANILTEAVRQAMLGEGIAGSDIQTSNFNVWSEERYPPFIPGPESAQPEPETFYRVENLMRLTIRDVARVGDVIQSALDSGANEVRGINFSIQDSTGLELLARDEAVADAEQRAQELASALGLNLGRPISVSEGAPGSSGFPVLLEKGGGGPAISGGEISVSIQVNVEYELIR